MSLIFYTKIQLILVANNCCCKLDIIFYINVIKNSIYTFLTCVQKALKLGIQAQFCRLPAAQVHSLSMRSCRYFLVFTI